LAGEDLRPVDAASHDPARHVLAAASMTRDLSRDSGDHVIVLHVHEFATGRFGRIQVDCREGEGVVEKVVSELQAEGVSAGLSDDCSIRRSRKLTKLGTKGPCRRGQRLLPWPDGRAIRADRRRPWTLVGTNTPDGTSVRGRAGPSALAEPGGGRRS
jgi:hypothetical protein